MPNRTICPRCGRPFPPPPGGDPERIAPPPPPGASCTYRQLYGQPRPRQVAEACVDPSGVSVHARADRNPFWPRFAHPRWLSCEQLYRRG